MLMFQKLLKSKNPVKFLLYFVMTIPVIISTKILILAIEVNRLLISFINLFTRDFDSKTTFAPGSITKRIIIIPPIHTTVAKMCRKLLKLCIAKFILFLHFVIRDIQLNYPATEGGVFKFDNPIKGMGFIVINPIPFSKAWLWLSYFELSAFLLFSVTFLLFCFNGIHPQPHGLFLSAIFFTSFIWILVHYSDISSSIYYQDNLFKYFS